MTWHSTSNRLVHCVLCVLSFISNMYSYGSFSWQAAMFLNGAVFWLVSGSLGFSDVYQEAGTQPHTTSKWLLKKGTSNMKSLPTVGHSTNLDRNVRDSIMSEHYKSSMHGRSVKRWGYWPLAQKSSMLLPRALSEHMEHKKDLYPQCLSLKAGTYQGSSVC